MLFFILSAIGKILTKDEERDRELMARIKMRDASALSELYDHYNRLLFGLIRTILKKQEEAEDTLQEVFINVWQKADSYDLERGTVYTWIVSLARNKSIDRLRSKVYKEQKKQSTSLDDEDVYHPLYTEEANPMEKTIFRDRAKRVRDALDKLTDKQRKMLEIAYFGGMSQREISDKFEIPLGTVKSRIRDGMMKLKEILSKELEL
ncbi:sigma-70 family RNA polymerase sigma factor [Gracilimonas mengyeensis]|uniref:RNA polymerase sigma-70 factor, ECF subfamily n=1 Tax=Gracilimonas mengyeensis TaxID=1302730 RepID=A0A521DNJ6_9BACT|nr:sigma-70 family RNA polymerase sigma factor [Gracilimonas mengyeensis]SMO73304.1 RNA polymerase sigma-70 factor, ECF subfamily [Gracilimonas mengyeensis]